MKSVGCCREPGRKHLDEAYAEASRHIGSVFDPSRRPKDPNKSYRGGTRTDIYGERSVRSSIVDTVGDPHSVRSGVAGRLGAGAEPTTDTDGPLPLLHRASPPGSTPMNGSRPGGPGAGGAHEADGLRDGPRIAHRWEMLAQHASTPARLVTNGRPTELPQAQRQSPPLSELSGATYMHAPHASVGHCCSGLLRVRNVTRYYVTFVMRYRSGRRLHRPQRVAAPQRR